MKKRIISFILALSMVLVCVLQTAWAAPTDNNVTYGDIINMYLDSFAKDWTNQDLENGDDVLDPDSVSLLVWMYNDSASQIGYMLHDVDGNGQPELIISSLSNDSYGGGGFYEDLIYQIYTKVNGKVVSLASSMERDRYYLGEDHTLINEGSGGAFTSSTTVFRIDSQAGRLSADYSVIYDGWIDQNRPWFIAYDHDENGYPAEPYLPISEYQYNNLKNSLRKESLKLTPLEYFEQFVYTEDADSLNTLTIHRIDRNQVVFTPFWYRICDFTATATWDASQNAYAFHYNDSYNTASGTLSLSGNRAVLTLTQSDLPYKEAGVYTFSNPVFEGIPQQHPFVDVPSDSFFGAAVLWAVENKITNGMDITHFSPDNACTRAQVVTFLWRAAGCPAPGSGNHPFTDVQADAFYYEAMLWAVDAGIINGMTATTFDPNGSCLRSQVATMLYRYMGKPAFSSQSNPFRDVAQGSYYHDAVLWAVENRVTNGMTPATFAPDATCTRGQIVTFLHRALG